MLPSQTTVMANQVAQDYLFQRIKELLPAHISMVDAVSEILHVSNDSAYRRIRGETPLILEEAKQLCGYFKLSLDQILNLQSGFTLFQTERLHYKNYSFEQYLSGILEQLKLINGFIRKEIIYLSKDLPFFHNFFSEPLFSFHYFFWMKSILRHPLYQDKNFSLDALSEQVKALGKDILQTYNNIPSTEIWNTECINSTIFQIEYYKDAGFFNSSNDIKLVYDSVEETIYHIKEQAEFGCKFIPGENPQLKKSNFRFFYNRVTLGDNTVVAVTDLFKTVFLNYDVMNYMITRDKNFCEDTYTEIQSLIKRSTMLSASSEKQRNIFFNILINKIEDRKRNL
jgi:plasmid maintenance system antidote protein VapI